MYRAVHSPGFMKGPRLCLHHKTGNIVERLVLWHTEKCVAPKKSTKLPFSTLQKAQADPQIRSIQQALWCLIPPPRREAPLKMAFASQGEGFSPLPPRKGRGNTGGRGNVVVRPSHVEGWWSHCVLIKGWGSGSEAVWLSTAKSKSWLLGP